MCTRGQHRNFECFKAGWISSDFIWTNQNNMGQSLLNFLDIFSSFLSFLISFNIFLHLINNFSFWMMFLAFEFLSLQVSSLVFNCVTATWKSLFLAESFCYLLETIIQ